MLNLALNLFVLFHTIQMVHNRQLNVYFTGVWCEEYDREYIETMECFISMDPTGKPTINAVLVLKKDVTHLKNQYRFLVDLKQKNDTYLSIDVNICEALSSSFNHVVTRLISEEIHRFSNLPYECPLRKNFRYILNNFTINTKYIPSFTPGLKWYSNSNFYVMQRKILRFDCNGVVDRKYKRNG